MTPIADKNVPTLSHAQYRDTRYFPALDGLRGLAVLMVLVYHCPRFAASRLERLQFAGDAGVDVFFVLSGFLITMLLLRDRERSDLGTPRLLSRFYVKRVLRIFPLYYLAIGLYWLKTHSSPDPLAVGAYEEALPYLVTYSIDAALGWGGLDFPAFGIAWSLGVEEKFYLCWPWLVLMLKPKKLLYVGIAVIGAVLCWRAWTMQTFAGDLTARMYYPFDLRMDGVMWGAVVACLLHRRETYGIAQRIFDRPGSLLIGLMLFAFTAVTMENDSFWRYLLLPLGAAFVIGAAVVRLDRTILRPLCIAPMRYLGRISYGMYVLHPLAISATARLVGTETLWQQMVCAVVATVLTIIVASASYRWFEAPIINLRSRWSLRATPAVFAPG